MRGKLNSKHKGFTLTETVIASGLLFLAMMPILKSLTTAQLDAIIIEKKTQSLILAQNKLDEIKARSIYSYSTNFNETNTSLSGSYLCNVTDDQDTSLREIMVSVGFDDDDDGSLDTGEIKVTLNTLIAKRWNL